MTDTVIRCLCCHDTFDDIRALNRHRGPDGDGRDEGETWEAADAGWSHA